MHKNTLQEIREDLSEKQLRKFKDLLEKYQKSDKIDILYNIAKKRFTKI